MLTLCLFCGFNIHKGAIAFFVLAREKRQKVSQALCDICNLFWHVYTPILFLGEIFSLMQKLNFSLHFTRNSALFVFPFSELLVLRFNYLILR